MHSACVWLVCVAVAVGSQESDNATTSALGNSSWFNTTEAELEHEWQVHIWSLWGAELLVLLVVAAIAACVVCVTLCAAAMDTPDDDPARPTRQRNPRVLCWGSCLLSTLAQHLMDLCCGACCGVRATAALRPPGLAADGIPLEPLRPAHTGVEPSVDAASILDDMA